MTCPLVNILYAELTAEKARLARLYERWQELEALRMGSNAS
jgi:hypothetical protein